MATNFYQQAKQMYPFMPEWVLRAYAAGMADSGGKADLAWQRVRQHQNYDATFAGNRRKTGPLAGSLRMTEIEYLMHKDSFNQTLREYGLDPTHFQNKYVQLVEGDKSIDEVRTQMQAIYSNLINNTPQAQATFQAYYGMDYNPEAMNINAAATFAMALDPDVGNDLLNRRITVAQIGGEAALRGFTRSLAQSERLASMGVTQGAARDIYSQAQDRLGGLNTLAERFNDLDPTFDLDEFEDAALGDAGQVRRAERLVQAETASFSGNRRVRQDESGGLSGLRQR